MAWLCGFTYELLSISACLVTANRLLTYTNEITTAVKGDRILDQQMDAKTGNYLRLKLQKTNGFLCDYSFTPPPLRIKCSRGEEQFTKKGDLSGRNVGAIILSTSQDEDGGMLPFTALQYSENGVTYKKTGSIITASLQDYYLTVDCNTLKILDSKVLPQKQLSVFQDR